MRAIAVGVGVVLGVCAAGAVAEAFSVSYDQKTTQGRQVTTGTVSMKDEMFRMDTTAEGQTMAIIRNASGTYTYMPAEGMAMKLAALNPSQQPVEGAEDYLQYLTQRQAEKIGNETVDGHACDIYRFNDPETKGTVTAWVWTEKRFPLKLEFDGAKGKMLMEFQNIQLGAKIPDSHFELPSGVQVMDMGNMFQMGQ